MRIARPRQGEPVRLVTNPDGSPRLGRDGLPRYRAVVDVGGPGQRRQVTTTHPSLSAARGWVASTRAQARSGTFTAPDRVTFNELADRWLASKSSVRPVTLNGYRHVLTAVRVRIGDRRVQSVTRADVDAVVSDLATNGARWGRPLSRRSLQYTLTTVRAVFRFGVPRIIPTNPADGVEIPHEAPRRGDITPWEPAELLTFRAVADRHPWAAAWRLSLSGLRRSEVLGLAWDAVDLDAGTVRVERGRVRVDGSRDATDAPKAAASTRTVPVESLHPGTVALLRSLRAAQAADRLAAGSAYTDTGYVLVDALGHPVPPPAYTAEFTRLCREAGVPRVRLHWLRHSVATLLHRSGVAPADAARLLGHSPAVHLSTYVTATQPGVDRAAAAFAAALAEAR